MNSSTEATKIFEKLGVVKQHLSSLIHPQLTPVQRDLVGIPFVDVVITPNEVNEIHGMGVLVRKIFPDSSSILSLRSSDTFAVANEFGAANFRFFYAGMIRPQIFAEVFKALWCIPIKRALCIPQSYNDALTAIAVKDLFNVPLCTYLINSQTTTSEPIPDYLMKELLIKSNLRLAISPEMRDFYEDKYQLKCWITPPIVAAELVQSNVNLPNHEQCELQTGVLVGNIWNQLELDLLRQITKQSKLSIDWYGSSNSGWLSYQTEQLEQDGITLNGFLPEKQLAEKLRQYPYAIVPTSPFNHHDYDEYVPINRLNLPVKLPFILATSHTPVIVLGDKNTAAAKFVERFGIGVVCDYNSTSFREVVTYICRPENQASMRQRAANAAALFSNEDMANWIWQSLEASTPCDWKFEESFPRLPSDTTHFIEPPLLEEIHTDFIPIYQSLRRLINQGFSPDFVLDVGASVGVWSYITSKLLPNARFILVDPLISKYDTTLKDQFLSNCPAFELVEVAVSNKSGYAALQISSDLYGSSLLHPSDFRAYTTINVKVLTLDALAQEKAITGRGLLKIDVQFAEHLVIEGAQSLMTQIDAVVLELSLVRYDERAKDLAEMVQMMTELGFRYYDDVGIWRSPVDGTLLQKDVLFIRKELFLPETGTL
ncbi:MAG: FkbM family methyltransferase [Leptolyngbyaceae cyanobacterium bins.302]|nr:FkbM family methyltransferase [Leptolyngbyaceae cyanobacterium bins.302]